MIARRTPIGLAKETLNLKYFIKTKAYTLFELLLVILLISLIAGVMVSKINLPQPKYIDIEINPENLYITSDGRYCYKDNTNWFFLVDTNLNNFYVGVLNENFGAQFCLWAEVERADVPSDVRWFDKIKLNLK